jgi:tRNA pseudouridine55 synthase
MLSGLLLLDKPAGYTSHDVVMVVRRALGESHIGHSGTLDPMATGLLILMVGPATKKQEAFQLMPKAYSGSAILGIETDTGDLEGEVTAEKPVPVLSEEALSARMQAWTGTLSLPAPKYSAIKHKGKPLYEYARKGIEVEVKLRVQEVHSWDLKGWATPEFRFLMRCASGTYVRAIAEALGRELGCGAALSALRRESIGTFNVAQAITLAELEAKDKTARAACLIGTDGLALAHV